MKNLLLLSCVVFAGSVFAEAFPPIPSGACYYGEQQCQSAMSKGPCEEGLLGTWVENKLCPGDGACIYYTPGGKECEVTNKANCEKVTSASFNEGQFCPKE